jgi:hypothetical protein
VVYYGATSGLIIDLSGLMLRQYSSIGFWVKTKGSSGVGKVILTSERFGILKENIVIEKNDPIL